MHPRHALHRLRFQELCNVALAVVVPRVELGIVAAGFECVVETRLDEMLDAHRVCDLVYEDAPVDLCFLTDGEAVGVDEGELAAGEGGVQRGFVIGGAVEDSYSLESCLFAGFGG